MPGRLLRRVRAVYRAASYSIAWRLVLGSGAVVTAALLAAAIALPQLYSNGLERQMDANLWRLMTNLMSFVDKENGRIVLSEPMTYEDYESAFSGYYYQINRGDEVMLPSRSLGGLKLEVQKPEALQSEIYYDTTLTGPPGGAQELRAATIMVRYTNLDLAEPLVLTVASDRRLINENIDDFRVTIVIAILGLGMVLVGTVFLQLRYGLRPLRRIPEALAAIRSGQTDRLTGSFAAEVEPLAREINALLDHNSEIVERARTHVGNLAHALKTPLAVLTNEAAGHKGEFAQTVSSQVGIMREQVDHHLSRARVAARAGILGARTSVMPVLEGLARTLEKIYRERNIAVAVAGPPDIAFRGERQDLEDMLGNLLDNACKFAKSRVSARAVDREGRLRIEIADDGPGVPSQQRRVAQKRGIRLDESAPGSGLGLSIVTDIAEIYGGSFRMDEAKLGGLLAVLDLPLAGGSAPKRGR
jgi:signal transduction histidine kinase